MADIPWFQIDQMKKLVFRKSGIYHNIKKIIRCRNCNQWSLTNHVFCPKCCRNPSSVTNWELCRLYMCGSKNCCSTTPIEGNSDPLFLNNWSVLIRHGSLVVITSFMFPLNLSLLTIYNVVTLGKWLASERRKLCCWRKMLQYVVSTISYCLRMLWMFIIILVFKMLKQQWRRISSPVRFMIVWLVYSLLLILSTYLLTPLIDWPQHRRVTPH